ncbi:hypothetical protein ACOSQ2_021263 [Xanthoceras sorbifolium]
MKPPDKTAPAYPRLQETQLPQATQNQPNQTTLVSEPSITTTPKQQIQLQSGPSITTTPAASKFNSSTVLRTLELSSIQTHMTRRGDRGVDQRSHQQLEIAPDLNRTQSTKEREGKEQRGRRIYGSRPNPAASYQ